MDTTIDELRAGWEQLREQVKALQLTAQFYAERNQQQITEKEKLQSALRAKDELLWWVTTTTEHRAFILYAPFPLMVGLAQMLATQGYTRENLEKR